MYHIIKNTTLISSLFCLFFFSHLLISCSESVVNPLACDGECLDSEIQDEAEIEETKEEETAEDSLPDEVEDLLPDELEEEVSLAGFGEECELDSECESDLCLIIGHDGLCTRYCNEDCPENWSCVLYSNSGSDAAHICLAGDICIDDDGDSFGIGTFCLGMDCDDSNPEIHPGIDEECDGIDNNCDENIDEGFDLSANPFHCGECGNICEGTHESQYCDAGECISSGCLEGFWDVDGEEENGCEYECIHSNEAIEACDGLDNDCDGEHDEGIDGDSLEEACYEGREGSANVGICSRGIHRCEDGIWSPCEGQILPEDELCDGVDNDCDGESDEDFPGLYQPCEVGTGACMREFLGTCSEDGLTLTCNTEPGEPGMEVCDGMDNNCNGITDEDETGEALTVTCYEAPSDTEGIGTCEAGIRACTGGVLSECFGQIIPATEICDGLDNNCNGEIDDGLDDCCEPGETQECGNSVGVCTVGLRTCTEDRYLGPCLDENGEPAVEPSLELCNNQDDNCDSLVDEEFDELNQPCETGIGACHETGNYVCSENGQRVTCNAVPSQPQDEECDGIDNNCNGIIDENEEDGLLEQICYDGPDNTAGVGICVAGFSVCRSGNYTECIGQVTPTDETCNGEDDNCDGEIDENTEGCCSPGDVRNCGTETGSCTLGEQTCTLDRHFGPCLDSEGNPVVTPGGERCNGEDDNCNGSVDEGFDGLGDSCNTGIGECENSGVMVCNNTGSGVTCNAVEGTPELENCDSLDNDCDGSVDEDNEGQPLIRDCYNGPDGTAGVGLCTEGTQICTDGEYSICNEEVLPESESCNEEDDDCDGGIDESDSDLTGGTTWYRDADQDGFGNPESTTISCTFVEGYVENNEDCDDQNSEARPNATEQIDGIDNNCDGEGYHGDYNQNNNTDLAGGDWEFTNFFLGSGSTIRITGTEPLRIYVIGDANLEGSINLAGSGGTNHGSFQSQPNPGGNGGGAGGGNGGDGACYNQSRGAQTGTGVGPGGSAANQMVGGGGGGGGHSTNGEAGHPGNCTSSRCGSNYTVAGGASGTVYGSDETPELMPGSGGGGGGWGVADNGDGGGGGGGGGAFYLKANSISISGGINASGGNGGGDSSGHDGGSGGGGSGGTIWLIAQNMIITGNLDAQGGDGGQTTQGGSNAQGGYGGYGADGRIWLDSDSIVDNNSSIVPVWREVP